MSVCSPCVERKIFFADYTSFKLLPLYYAGLQDLELQPDVIRQHDIWYPILYVPPVWWPGMSFQFEHFKDRVGKEEKIKGVYCMKFANLVLNVSDGVRYYGKDT